MPAANPNPLFKMVHSDEFKKKRRDGIANRLFSDAPTTLELLKDVGENVAVISNCLKPNTIDPWVYYGPIKERGRGIEKVMGEYGGEWHELKDVVRMTIIAPTMKELRDAQANIRELCTIQYKMSIIKDTEIFANVHPCGYSGLIIVVRLPNGRPGEIQVNIPEIIYGKEKEKIARPGLGSKYFEIKGKFMLEGGYHHILYEIYRAAPFGAIGKEAAKVSKMYLDYLRG